MAKARSPVKTPLASTQSEPKRGRPNSVRARQAVISAAVDLLDERGVAGFTVDEVARRSGVSKATIYKHWTGGFDLATQAYGQIVTSAVPVVSTGDVVADLTDLICRVARFYASPRGAVVAQIIGAGPTYKGGTFIARDMFFTERRSATTALIREGQANGQLRADLDPELGVDFLFGAIVYRLFNGMSPLTQKEALATAAMGMRAIVN